jgi:hypothetical protein
MLPLPNLDDRYFDQMVQDARKAIPKLLPQWTDENAHDPGVTLVELMSWMTELQQYYLNRITEQNEKKFLKLLGVRLREATLASCDVTFEGMRQQLVLPKGTPLQALDQPFEMVETIRLIPSTLEKVIVRTDTVAGDFTSNNHAGIAYYAFGPHADKGSRLFIGFDRILPEQTDISISLALFENYPVPVGKDPGGAAHLISSARVSWTYAGSEQGDHWLPVEMIRDTTVSLSQSGDVIFRLPSEIKSSFLYPADDKRRFWICCNLEEDGYELPPKLEKISLNTVQARQQETFTEVISWNGTGEQSQRYEASSYLAWFGSHLLQVQDKSGKWRDWQETASLEDSGQDEFVYALQRNEFAKSIEIQFGNGTHGFIPHQGKGNIRLVAYQPDFAMERWIGNSNGLPEQSFQVSQDRMYRADNMLLQVGYLESTAAAGWLWEDWLLVDDFDNSLSTDRHYMFEPHTSTIRFGNNEQGWIPPKSGELNIRFLSLQTGGGARGNIKSGMLNTLAVDVPEWQGITVTNPFHARGGAQWETLDEAKLRVGKELNTPSRAVTSEDYEEIAAATPGLRVARVKAIPLYRPGMRDYPKVKAPAQMTIVVVPYSEADKPTAGKGFLETIQKHLDVHRLLTTEVHVIPAEYIKITIHAEVVVEPQFKDEQYRIIRELKRLLQPMGHADGTEGWKFGRSVYKGDIYGTISRIKGVVYVKDLWIDAEGSGARKDGSGDIHIPPYGLVYSGDHEIELMSQSDL